MLKLIYRIFIFPSIFCLFALIAIFSEKVRRGFVPRYKIISSLKKWYSKNQPLDKVILYHAASLGEFEHIKPLFLKLKENYHTINIVTLFSPSGYDHARDVHGVDLVLYMPFDTFRSWRKIYDLIRPIVIIISKHDVWPAQLWCAHRYHIPVFLVNASLAKNSSRLRPGIRYFLKNIYQSFTHIHAISQEDAERFSKYFGLKRISVVGDTKHDQVISRKISGRTDELIDSNWYQNKWIFIGGSVWPQDLDHLIPACIKLLKLNKNIRIILAPHQPEEKIITTIIDAFNIWGVARFSDKIVLKDTRVLIIDCIGKLATIYKYAQVAYVGGSFSQGVHNVMEAAIYGIPTLYGPVHQNSYEALRLNKNSGGIVINTSEELFQCLYKFYQNNNERKNIGHKALEFVQENAGATERIIKELRSYLGEEHK
jgi:3-deoxy-D-manno-octulosonic-acid transferase